MNSVLVSHLFRTSELQYQIVIAIDLINCPDKLFTLDDVFQNLLFSCILSNVSLFRNFSIRQQNLCSPETCIEDYLVFLLHDPWLTARKKL